MENLAVFDLGEKFFDRYTVIFLDNPVSDDPYYSDRYPYRYPYLGMSDRPFHPQGFGQSGEIEIPPNALRQLRKGKGQRLFSHLGKLISFNDLPEDCQKLVNADLAMISLSQLESTF